MRISKFPLATLKETPADAEIISHQLMIRAGLIRRLTSGLYTWLPLGMRVLHKVQTIVREEMDRSGALEVLMPTVHPAELWKESTRWDQYGPELLRFKDRHERDYCYGPTHEEVITDYFRREITSYKQLPVNYYQIQLKFRDEIRPRFGVMRAREFIMKDAYSFHVNDTSLHETYRLMYQTYSNIFSRLGLKFRAVQADSGSIGGNESQEFHVLANSGEDAIAYSTESDYAANIQLAASLDLSAQCPAPQEIMQLVETPEQRSIDEVSTFLKIPKKHCLKTLLVQGVDNQTIALVLRGDHILNETKVEKLDRVEKPLKFVDADIVKTIADCSPGFIGPVKLKNAHIIADYAALSVADFVCGANQDGKHYRGVNWQRDLPKAEAADLRDVIEGDPSPDGKGTLKIVRGIEVGHIFKLGNKYSKAMKANVLDETGKSITVLMGCYGIGVTRVIAAAIEQNHDDRGIIWPEPIAPFQIALLTINAHKSAAVKEYAEKFYQQLNEAEYEVLLDDRDIRPGIKFADMELMGIPHRLVLSDKGLESNSIEYKKRDGSEEALIPLDQLMQFLASKLSR